jgi:hypothetical protein
MSDSFVEQLKNPAVIEIITILKSDPSTLTFIKNLIENPDFVKVLPFIDTEKKSSDVNDADIEENIDDTPIINEKSKTYKCSKCGLTGHNKIGCKKRKRTLEPEKAPEKQSQKESEKEPEKQSGKQSGKQSQKEPEKEPKKQSGKQSKKRKIPYSKTCSCCGKEGKTHQTCGNIGHYCVQCTAGPANYDLNFKHPLDSDHGRDMNAPRNAKKRNINYTEHSIDDYEDDAGSEDE